MATGAREPRVTQRVLQMPSLPVVMMPDRGGWVARVGCSMWMLAAKIFLPR